MASLTQAERARAQKGEFLRKLGAHAVGVEQKPTRRQKKGTAKTRTGTTEGYVVIAYFDEEPKQPLPEHLEVKSGKRTLKVPLAIRRASRFQLE